MSERSAPGREGGTLRFVLAPSLDSIAVGHRRMAEFLSGLPLHENVRDRLDVVFEEIVANIVRHGFDDGRADHAILVELEQAGDTVAVAIEDNGTAFNPLTAAPPPRADSIEEVEIGGLGLPLIKAYTKELRYERVLRTRHTPPFVDGLHDRNRLSFAIAPG